MKKFKRGIYFMKIHLFFFLCFSYFVCSALTQEESADSQITHPLDLNLKGFSLGSVSVSNSDSVSSSSEDHLALEDTYLFPSSAEEECAWFLKIALENEDDAIGASKIFTNGAIDNGYTHGHITSLIKSCSSGSDFIVRLSSKLYTDTYGYDLSRLKAGESFEVQQEGKEKMSFVVDKTQNLFFIRNGIPIGETAEKLTPVLNSEEETRLTLEWSDWRDFEQDYYDRLSVFLGRLSVNDSFVLAGHEQRLFHNALDGVGYIRKYKYRKGGETKYFAGTLIAFGKTLPLSKEGVISRQSSEYRGTENRESVCSSPCFAYVRGEAGVELVSDESLSFVYIASKVNKNFYLSDTGETIAAASIGVKAKQYPFEGDQLLEGFVGLDLRLFEGIFLHSLIKKREILSEGYYLKNDWDDEPILFLEIDFRL